MNTLGKPPSGWDKNIITQNFDAARSNQFATFHNLKDWVDRLSDIDRAYRKAIEGLNNTNDWFPGFFLPRSHSSFLAACSLCWAGQTPETYPVLRLCLENALYSFYFYKNPQTCEVWLKRSDNDKTKKAVRDEFKAAKMIQLLQQVDAKEGKVANQLNERLIDFGAHPNELGMMQAMVHRPDLNGFDYLYLTSNQLVIESCLKTLAQVGVCSLSIYRNIYKTRFDVLGLTKMLDDIRKCF